MTGQEEHGGAGVRFAVVSRAVEGYGGRGVDGTAYRPPSGYLFLDKSGDTWWIIFQEFPDSFSGPPGSRRYPWLQRIS